MVRQIQITVKNERADLVLRTLQDESIAPLVMGDVAHFQGPTHTLVLLKCGEKQLRHVITELERAGIGDRFGMVDVLQLMATKPLYRSRRYGGIFKKRRFDSLSHRVPVEEIYEIIDAESHLTFNFVALTIFAGTIAGLGLASNSDATVVASMLVSPLMNPILLLTFGSAIRDRDFVMRGLINEGVGVAITIATGLIIGVIIAQFYGPDCEHYSPTGLCYGILRSEEMISRGTPINLVPGFFIAIPAGASVAVAITAGGSGAAFAGVAIAVALLPPLVNSGMSFGLALVYWIQPRGDYPGGSSYEEQMFFLRLALYSFCLFSLNMLCIFLSAYTIFRVKGVHVLPARSNRWASDSKNLNRRLRSASSASASSTANANNMLSHRVSFDGDVGGWTATGSAHERLLVGITDDGSGGGRSITASDNLEASNLQRPSTDAAEC